MKRTTFALISATAATVIVATVALADIGYEGVTAPANASTYRSSVTEAARLVSAGAPSSAAGAWPLPTTRVTAPSGFVDYAASWRLESSSERSLSIFITGPGSGGGCTTLGYVQIAETPTTVTVTPNVFVDQGPGVVCTANLSGVIGTITLDAPLAHRALIHGTTMTPRAAGWPSKPLAFAS